jgi:tRNA (guanine37-N1)-methyltransferase
MMRIDIATLFVDMCESVLQTSIVGRARKENLIEINCHDIRNYTQNKHRHIDDAPYGGGNGMVMQAEPIYECYLDVCNKVGEKPYVIYMSPQGKTLTQKRLCELKSLDNILILCGHYEGVDERIIEEIVDEEISIGDYVLTGGELPALVLVDGITRLCDGVLANEDCFSNESHFDGILEHPQYTRPEVWRGKAVPSVLLSGHHANIEKWKKEQAEERTRKKRPDLTKNVCKD